MTPKQALALSAKPSAPHKAPLFLGGKDSLSNLERTDLDVYLSLCAKLWNKVKDLPEGTPIGELIIGESE
jgi:hypothetical protein